jgi:hypothetical protein
MIELEKVLEEEKKEMNNEKNNEKNEKNNENNEIKEEIMMEEEIKYEKIDMKKEIKLLNSWFSENNLEKLQQDFKKELKETPKISLDFINSRKESIKLLKQIREDYLDFFKKTQIATTIGSTTTIIGSAVLIPFPMIGLR